MGDLVVNDCRFYEAKYPSPGEVVIATIDRISDDGIGAYVTLDEYADIEGMIPLSELSRRRVRSVQKLLRVGKREPMAVLRVDQDKGYIDLTKRAVSVDEAQECEDRFTMSKKVNTIITQAAKKSGMETESLYMKLGWPLYAKYGHAYNAFKVAATNPGLVFDEFNLDAKLLAELMLEITHQLKPKRAKLHAKIDVKCLSYQGIEGIRKALKAAEAVSTETTQLSVRLIAPPEYVISTTTTNAEEDLKLMNKAIRAAEEIIKQEGGTLKVLVSPREISEHEEKELQVIMDRAERENVEVSGDDDVDGY
ncbi:hypothetical protein LPJ61_005499 [Coemansia biformis]|uniref:S1 motif domain-containing protein n=1 Tax=Coemansia biformis TaxID=1286918 RepID=A0A9W8CWJ8_9FUNG|nr:hypothetical protein LPJ61_005499 [Coemansia biformis]